MEDNVGGGGGYAGDPNEQFHRNEVISAVTDDGFLGEEDDDYEDLYNDVNVGENFLQSMKKSEDYAAKNEEAAVERRPMQMNLKPTLPQQAVAESGGPGPGIGPGTGTGPGLGGERKDDGVSSARVSAGMVVDGYPQQNVGFRGPAVSGGGPSGHPSGGAGLRVELGQPSINKGVGDLEEHTVSNSVPNQGGVVQQQPPPQAPSVGSAPVVNVATVGNAVNEGLVRQVGVNVNVNGAGGNGYGNVGAAAVSIPGGGGTAGGGGQGTILFVGDLHWWTTDAELEAELSKYGQVKEVKFFDEKASGKSKGYCQVEFYDPAAATACKDGMNGNLFNGRPCVVAFASPYTVKRMGEAQVNRNQQMSQSSVPQGRRGTVDTPAKGVGSNIATGGNYQAGGDNNRGYGRGNWGRGNTQGIGGRGPMGLMRGRAGGMGGRGMMGNGGGAFGQGIGATPPLMHPQAMIGQGFDPGFGGPMGRMGGMGGYGGFPGAPTPPLGILSSFPPVGNVGLPGVAPHVNPAFFGRGMPMNSMGMMPTAGVDGPNMGMWSDSNMGWAGEDHGGRAGESSYGEEAASEHQYGEVSHDRGPWPSSAKEKDRGSERDWSGSSERRYRDDREPGLDRDMPREKDLGHENDWEERRPREERDSGLERERERNRDRERSRDRERDRDRDRERDRHRDERDRHSDHHRYREREAEHDDDWDRGRSSRTHSKSRMSHGDEQRSRSRDAEYGKRRRITSE